MKALTIAPSTMLSARGPYTQHSLSTLHATSTNGQGRGDRAQRVVQSRRVRLNRGGGVFHCDLLTAEDVLALSPAAARGSASADNAHGAARAVARNAPPSPLGPSKVALLMTPLDVLEVQRLVHARPVGGVQRFVVPMHPASVPNALQQIIPAPAVTRAERHACARRTDHRALPHHLGGDPCTRRRRRPGAGHGAYALESGATELVLAATTTSPFAFASTAIQPGVNSPDATVTSVFCVLHRVCGASALWRGRYARD